MIRVLITKPCGTEYVINFLRRERGNLKSFKFPITLRGYVLVRCTTCIRSDNALKRT